MLCVLVLSGYWFASRGFYLLSDCGSAVRALWLASARLGLWPVSCVVFVFCGGVCRVGLFCVGVCPLWGSLFRCAAWGWCLGCVWVWVDWLSGSVLVGCVVWRVVFVNYVSLFCYFCNFV